MDVLLLLTYTAICIVIFKVFKVPLNKWMLATFLMASSKKGFSAHQLHRTIGVTYKTAWFMFHRIREAMRAGDLAPMGSGGGTVEVDETFIGREPGTEVKAAYHHKMKVLSLVDRETGEVRLFVVDKVSKKEILPILRENIAKEATVYTDESSVYNTLSSLVENHDHVKHKDGEYGRGDVHTNTIEVYYSIFKRGMKGIYQHCGK